MGSADDYAAWIVKNQDKRGTPDFATVAAAYQQAKNQENPPAPPPPEEVSPMQAALISAGKSITRLGQGAQNLYYSATGNDAANAALANTVATDNAAVAPVEAAHPVASTLGAMAPALATGSPLALAALGGLEYGTPEERAARAAGGYLGGKLGNLVGSGAARVLQPVKGVADEFTGATRALFDKYGINPLPSQVTGSAPLGWLESTVAQLPGGASVRAAVDAQQQGLNKATMSAIGSDSDLVTPEAVQAAKDALGTTMRNVTSPVTVAIDDTAQKQLDAVASSYMKRLDVSQKPIVQSYLDDIKSFGGALPGDVYQNTRVELGQLADGARNTGVGLALKGIQKALDGAFQRSADAESGAAAQAARTQYRIAATVNPMATITGDISPARLASGAKSLPGAGGDLAQLGARMKSLPNSGTMQRLIYQGILGGGVGAGTELATGDPLAAAKYGAGTFAAPYLASKLLTSGVFRKYLENGLLNLPPTAEQKLIESFGGAGGLLGIGAAGQLGQRFSQ